MATIQSKIKDYGTMVSKNGNLNAFISFDVVKTAMDGTSSVQTLSWMGAFTEKAKKLTIKTLLTCGMPANATIEQMAALANGPESNLLNMEKPFNLVLEDEQDVDANGVPQLDANGQPKMRTRIRFINDPELSIGIQRATQLTTAQMLQNANCGAALMECARELGLIGQPTQMPMTQQMQMQQMQQMQMQQPQMTMANNFASAPQNQGYAQQVTTAPNPNAPIDPTVVPF